MKDDTTSLIVLCDSDSFITKRTQTTTTTSKLSMNFTFDAELIQHRAYKSTLRSLMRRGRLRSDPGRPTRQDFWVDPLGHEESSHRSKRSHQIDKILQEDSMVYRRQVRILALGPEAQNVMIALSRRSSARPTEKALTYRPAVFRTLTIQVVSAISPASEQLMSTQGREYLTVLKSALADGSKFSPLFPKGLCEDMANALRFCSRTVPLVGGLGTYTDSFVPLQNT